MIFKSLHIHGFKSFVDKTVIEFPQGITAIVGPNGSGKSNIMDSLRWVFGEQRASELRGGDMGDVIFAGSEKRRAAGYAEVGLTLSDISNEVASKWGTFSEVTISRKIFKTGEREYFINNRKCRLKDIKDIFFDTGLGAKSISIIEQERVTKIVNSTPEELRYFLEETAGVMRYKDRRKEAETRLKQTQENLSRISDLLSVMAEDIQKLTSQVDQVQKYRQLRDRKSGFEKAFLCATYARLLKEKSQYQTVVDTKRSELSALVGDNQSKIDLETVLSIRQEELRELLKLLRGDYDHAKQQLAEAESNIKVLNSNLANADRTQKDLQQNITATESRLEEITERLSEITDTLEDTIQLVEDFKERADEYSTAIAEYRLLLERANDEKKAINNKYLSSTQKLTDSINKINLKQAEIASHKSTIGRLKREQETVIADADSLQKRLDVSKRAVADLEIKKAKLKDTAGVAYEAWQSRDKERVKLAKELSDKEVQLKTSSNQIAFLRSEIQSKVTGNVSSDLIVKYSGKPYLHLDNSSPEDNIFYGDLFVFDNKYKDDLLGDIEGYDCSIRFIFSTDIPALPLASDRLKKITNTVYKDGNIYKKVGVDDPAVALLGMKERLLAEERRESDIKVEYTALKERLDTLQHTIEGLYAEYSAQADLIKAVEMDYSTTSSTIKSLEEQRQRIVRNMGIIEKEISLALDGIDISEQAVFDLEQLRDRLSAELANVDDERSMVEEKVENFTDLLDEKREEHSAVSRELARYNERKNALEGESVQLTKDRSASVSALSSLNDRLNDLTTVQVEMWKAGLADAYTQKDESATKVLLLSDNIADCDKEQQEIVGVLADTRQSLSDINKKIHEIDLAIADQLGKLESNKTNIDTVAEQMMAVFNEDVSVVWQQYSELGGSRQKIADEIAVVEKEIEELGPLNMAAEDEFAAKTEQYNHQIAQQKDIDESIVNLSNLIAEIDANTVQLFTETFYAVQKNFTQVFTSFFGSGSADLTLTDPDNMLTTGVELSINPPGKKVSHKNLLSGGEKALAALTLLFSLFLQRPTPFCFLDEVDAPLDDANAGRFINMVRSMSSQTQFVIITHKHQTMAAADSLYGVTMQEGGVSTILSVDLR